MRDGAAASAAPGGGAEPGASRVLRLPFPGRSALWRLATGHGRCIQGVDGAATHRGTLAYSFDFKLAVGTPILAAADGVVAAVVAHFQHGSAKPQLAARANFIAVRHADGAYSRYYHLRPGGAVANVGDSVKAGQLIAWSGNTGYTGGPHLHFDVVNVLPEETATLSVVDPPQCRRDFNAVAAAFSCDLPPTPRTLRLRIINDEMPRDDEPYIALSQRNAKQTFATNIEQLARHGAAAALIWNNHNGPEVFAMGGSERLSSIPAVLISKEDGSWLKQQLADHGEIRIAIGAHASVLHVKTLSALVANLVPPAKTPLSFKYGRDLKYVARTLPIAFLIGADAVVPQQPQIYPPLTLLCNTGGKTTKKKTAPADAPQTR